MDADPPVAKLAIAILTNAVQKGASSLTIVAEESADSDVGYDCNVWFEVGGDWVREMKPPAKLHLPLVRQMLEIAGLDPRHNIDQIGHFAMRTARGDFYFQLTVTCRPKRQPLVAIERTAASTR